MYNDDVLSPYFSEFFNTMIKKNENFIMGYGKTFDINGVYKFKPLNFKLTEKINFLKCYFGSSNSLKYYGVPVSPISCISKTEHLKCWVNFTQKFAEQSKFREYYMIKKNIGPDIIIFLSNIIKTDKIFI